MIHVHFFCIKKILIENFSIFFFIKVWVKNIILTSIKLVAIDVQGCRSRKKIFKSRRCLLTCSRIQMFELKFEFENFNLFGIGFLTNL